MDGRAIIKICQECGKPVFDSNESYAGMDQLCYKCWKKWTVENFTDSQEN